MNPSSETITKYLNFNDWLKICKFCVSRGVETFRNALNIIQEIDNCKSSGLTNELVESSSSKNAVCCIAAYLINYEKTRFKSCEKFKTALLEQFEYCLTFGSSFVNRKDYNDRHFPFEETI